MSAGSHRGASRVCYHGSTIVWLITQALVCMRTALCCVVLYLIMTTTTRVMWQDGKWAGGLNMTLIANAESRALNSYLWFRNHSNIARHDHLYLDAAITGTGVGLSKMPYLRFVFSIAPLSRGRPG